MSVTAMASNLVHCTHAAAYPVVSNIPGLEWCARCGSLKAGPKAPWQRPDLHEGLREAVKATERRAPAKAHARAPSRAVGKTHPAILERAARAAETRKR